MQLKINQFLTVVITSTVISQCLASTNEIRVKREGPDFAGIAIQAAGTAFEAFSSGAALKHNFKIKHGESMHKMNDN